MFKKLSALLAAFGKKAIKVIQKTLKSFGKDATGATIKSLRQATEIDTSKGVELDIFGSKAFDYIEDGRPAGAKMPPAGVLKEWMQARGIPLAAEFVIRRSIGVKGIPATPVLETSFVEIKLDFEKKVFPKIFQTISNTITTSIKKGFQYPTK